MAEAVGFLFCGKATAVATCHRQLAKSRRSNPPKYQKYDRHPYRAPVKFLAKDCYFNKMRLIVDFYSTEEVISR